MCDAQCEPAAKRLHGDDLRPGEKCPMQESTIPGLSQEVSHFLSVCFSIAGYEEEALNHVQSYGTRLHRGLKSQEDKDLWCGQDPESLVAPMRTCVHHNQELLNELVMDLEECPVGPPGGLGIAAKVYRIGPGILQVPPGFQQDYGNVSKARSTLRQFVRDWSVEGAEERDRCYGPLIKSLLEHVPLASGARRPNGMPRVLTPGSGLGRLTFEAAMRGYFAEGNEFSYHMLVGTAWVLQQDGPPLNTTIYPFVLDTRDRKGIKDHLRGYRIPDVVPGSYCEDPRGFGGISMRSGEFAEVYADQAGEWDAVLTAFFLDTAHNVFLYIRVLATILRPGGLWANLGPLLWHYSPDGGGSYDTVSVELSWDEVRPAVEQYFEIKELCRQDALYTDSGHSWKKKVYHCLFFSAVRNNTPVSGTSKHVW